MLRKGNPISLCNSFASNLCNKRWKTRSKEILLFPFQEEPALPHEGMKERRKVSNVPKLKLLASVRSETSNDLKKPKSPIKRQEERHQPLMAKASSCLFFLQRSAMRPFFAHTYSPWVIRDSGTVLTMAGKKCSLSLPGKSLGTDRTRKKKGEVRRKRGKESLPEG